MKRLIFMLVVMSILIYLVFTFGCADLVIGDSPIVVVGDTAYVFATEEDKVKVYYFSCDWWEGVTIDLYREIEEGAVVHFKEQPEDIRSCVVSIDGRVRVLTLHSCADDDECNIRIEFNWNQWGPMEVTE